MKKKPIVIFLLAVTLLSICFVGSRFREQTQLDHIVHSGKLLCNMYPVNTYLYDGNYCVVIFQNGQPTKCTVFSNTRQPIHAMGAEPVTISELQHFLGKSLTEIEQALGPYHADIGSGYFMPSYVTLDGCLVCFTFTADDQKVTHIGKTDLFTGESIEWYLAAEGA